MTNIKFPKTNIVECVFCYRQTRDFQKDGNSYDEYDKVRDTDINRLKRYVYRVPKCLEDQLQVGDAVLVHCQTGYQMAMVASINAFSSYDEKSLAPVVCKCDLTSYIDEVERYKQLAAMKAAIDREKKRLESMVTYELIADKNPEFKAMLEAFKEMGGEF